MAANRDKRDLNRFLAVLGVLLLGVAVAGLFLDKPAELTGGFLIAGLALCLFAALTSRLVGTQKVGLTGAEFNFAALEDEVEEGEKELQTKTLPEIEEVL